MGIQDRCFHARILNFFLPSIGLFFADLQVDTSHTRAVLALSLLTIFFLVRMVPNRSPSRRHTLLIFLTHVRRLIFSPIRVLNLHVHVSVCRWWCCDDAMMMMMMMMMGSLRDRAPSYYHIPFFRKHILPSCCYDTPTLIVVLCRCEWPHKRRRKDSFQSSTLKDRHVLTSNYIPNISSERRPYNDDTISSSGSSCLALSSR